jgi:hypothetical protein
MALKQPCTLQRAAMYTQRYTPTGSHVYTPTGSHVHSVHLEWTTHGPHTACPMVSTSSHPCPECMPRERTTYCWTVAELSNNTPCGMGPHLDAYQTWQVVCLRAQVAQVNLARALVRLQSVVLAVVIKGIWL